MRCVGIKDPSRALPLPEQTGTHQSHHRSSQSVNLLRAEVARTMISSQVYQSKQRQGEKVVRTWFFLGRRERGICFVSSCVLLATMFFVVLVAASTARIRASAIAYLFCSFCSSGMVRERVSRMTSLTFTSSGARE